MENLVEIIKKMKGQQNIRLARGGLAALDTALLPPSTPTGCESKRWVEQPHKPTSKLGNRPYDTKEKRETTKASGQQRITRDLAILPPKSATYRMSEHELSIT